MTFQDQVLTEVSKAVVGKEDILRRTLQVILAGGHVLLEDMPGVGKTTLALAFSRALGLRWGRVQFTFRCGRLLSLQQTDRADGLPTRRGAVQPLPGR